MGRKRDTSIEHDRLRSIVLKVLDDDDLDLDVSKFARQVGFDTNTRKGRAAAQSIRRWVGERWEKTATNGPGETFPRALNRTYRVTIFNYVRSLYWDEYIKPLPQGEKWITFEESERWFSDTHSTGPVRRNPEDLDDFARYLREGGIITNVTRRSVTAEMSTLGGESSERTYGPAGGLIEDDYQCLSDDEPSREELAWGVIDNLLWKKGLLSSQIERARRLLVGSSLAEIVEAHSFEVIATALFDSLTQAPKGE
jgi:hypothetical protein